MGYKADINFSAIGDAIIKKAAAAQKILYAHALSDSNRYCRVDSGRLRASSIAAGKPSSGRMVWRAPYAQRVYTSGKPSVKINPNASLMWAHRAAELNRARWLAAVKAAMRGAAK